VRLVIKLYEGTEGLFWGLGELFEKNDGCNSGVYGEGCHG